MTESTNPYELTLSQSKQRPYSIGTDKSGDAAGADVAAVGLEKFSGYLRFGGHGGHWENEEIVGHKVDTFNKEDLKTLEEDNFLKIQLSKIEIIFEVDQQKTLKTSQNVISNEVRLKLPKNVFLTCYCS